MTSKCSGKTFLAMVLVICLLGCASQHSKEPYTSPPEGAKVIGSFVKGSFWKSNQHVWILAVDTHFISKHADTEKTPIIVSYGKHIIEAEWKTDTLASFGKVELEAKAGKSYIVRGGDVDNHIKFWIEETND
jgi:hypothetical protein